MNKIIQIGNLTRDPESRVIPSGKTVCSFTIAVNSNWGKEEVLFLDITSWNKTAENCQKYLKKGSKVAVEGRLRMEKWEDKQGNQRNKISAVADNVTFLPNAEQATHDAKRATGTPEPFAPTSTETAPAPQSKSNEPEALSAPGGDSSGEDIWSGTSDEIDDVPF